MNPNPYLNVEAAYLSVFFFKRRRAPEDSYPLLRQAS